MSLYSCFKTRDGSIFIMYDVAILSWLHCVKQDNTSITIARLMMTTVQVKESKWWFLKIENSFASVLINMLHVDEI